MTLNPAQPIVFRLLGLAMLAAALLAPMPSVAQDFLLDVEEPGEAMPRIIASTQSLQPGKTTTIAVHFDIKEKWHLYWTNPEGAGFTPAVKWTLPAGYEISGPRWPAPQTFLFVGNTQFGYENQLSMLYDLSVPDDATGEIKLVAGLTWLVCDETNCVPNPGYPKPVTYELALPISDEAPTASAEADLIKKAESSVPQPAGNLVFKTELTDDGYTLVIETPSEAAAKTFDQDLYFFSSRKFVIDPAAEQRVAIEGKTVRLQLSARKTDEFGDPIKHDPPITELRGVLTAPEGFGPDRPTAILVGDRPTDEQTDTSETASNDESEPEAAGTINSDSQGQEPLGFAFALGMAFVGGLILNLMPCVFPVLSIKILGFVQVAGEKPATVRRHGYAFGIGVLLSFWVLVGVLLGIRAAAGVGSVSWGYQLQEPIFVLGMLILMFLIGLNLIGTFEVGVGLSAKVGQASQSVQHDGYGKSFFTGVLATLIATPCTAPFMAPAIGAALGMPYLQAFLIFTALGVGMALPYVLLSCFPSLMRFLPRPGAWMESFKQAMAFPMFATAGWLAWVYIGLTSEQFGLTLLISLSVLALGVWIYGRWSTPMRTTQTRWIARAVALITVLGSIGYIHFGAVSVRDQITEANRARAAGEYVYEWIEYTPQTVEQLRASGRPVLVDFTARWCAICQVNKKSSLRTDSVEALYKEHNVALVEADNTMSNPEINKVLQKYNRAGVPLYLVFPADGGEPEVLPELLTPELVRDAILKASETAPATASR